MPPTLLTDFSPPPPLFPLTPLFNKQADGDHAKDLQAVTGAQERTAAALSEAQEEALEAGREADSLRAELQTLRDRSEEQLAELSSALKDARSQLRVEKAGKVKALREVARVQVKTDKGLGVGGSKVGMCFP